MIYSKQFQTVVYPFQYFFPVQKHIAAAECRFTKRIGHKKLTSRVLEYTAYHAAYLWKLHSAYIFSV